MLELEAMGAKDDGGQGTRGYVFSNARSAREPHAVDAYGRVWPLASAATVEMRW